MSGLNSNTNSILQSLSNDDISSFGHKFVAVDLPRGRVVAGRESAFENVFFLSSGIASVLAVARDGHQAEAGMIGREGLTSGSAIVADGGGLFDVVMQISGFGHMMSVGAFRAATASSARFHDLVVRYGYAYSGQVSMTALTNGAYTIDRRLARWLLMCQDRLDGDEVHVTHDYMAMMLATRRPSVTVALHRLEGERFIRSLRGKVVIRDRVGLEAFAGSAYGGAELEYARLLGSQRLASGGREHGNSARELNVVA
jgi:hypothetical protein